MHSRPMDLGSPGEGGTCRVCDRALDAAGRCGHCGATFGVQHRCPHCRGVADVELGGRWHAACRLCGGPRVPLEDPALRPSGEEVAPLLRARSALRRWLSLRAGAAASAAVGALGLASGAAAIALAPLWLGAGLGAVALVPLLAARTLARRAGAARVEGEAELDAAWTSVARDVLAQHGGAVTEAELAQLLRTTPAHARTLLAHLHAGDHVTSHISEAGEVLVTSRGRVRVAAPLEDPPLAAGVAADEEQEHEVPSPPFARRL